jgi:hypothetical protein
MYDDMIKFGGYAELHEAPLLRAASTLPILCIEAGGQLDPLTLDGALATIAGVEKPETLVDVYHTKRREALAPVAFG